MNQKTVELLDRVERASRVMAGKAGSCPHCRWWREAEDAVTSQKLLALCMAVREDLDRLEEDPPAMPPTRPPLPRVLLCCERCTYVGLLETYLPNAGSIQNANRCPSCGSTKNVWNSVHSGLISGVMAGKIPGPVTDAMVLERLALRELNVGQEPRVCPNADDDEFRGFREKGVTGRIDI